MNCGGRIYKGEDITVSIPFAISGYSDLVVSYFTNGDFHVDKTEEELVIDGGYAFAEFDNTELDTENPAHLWCFTGNEEIGYQIYNKQAGATKVLAAPIQMMGSTGAGSYPVLKEKDNLPEGYIAVWRFMDSRDLGSTDVAYAYMYEDGYISNKVNNRDNKLAFWNGGQDAGSTLRILYVETTTSIDELNVENGVNAVYDLQGRRLQEAAKGINIVDGEKVLVK